MIKFTFTRNKTVTATRTEVAVVSVPVLHRVGHAIRTAPTHHRILSFLVFAVIWALLEYVLHYEVAAKGAELFGLAPAADKVLRMFIGDGE